MVLTKPMGRACILQGASSLFPAVPRGRSGQDWGKEKDSKSASALRAQMEMYQELVSRGELGCSPAGVSSSHLSLAGRGYNESLTNGYSIRAASDLQGDQSAI